MHKSVFYAGLLLITAACTSPQMLLNEQLASQSVAMPVSGRQGWMIRQEVYFGEYTTDRVQRGWTRDISADLFLGRLENAREQYTFSLFDTQNGSSLGAYTVSAARNIQGMDIPLGRFLGESISPGLRELASLSIETKDVFAATLYNNKRLESWHLMILSPRDSRQNGSFAGVLANEDELVIEILPVRQLSTHKTIGNDIVGYDFIWGGRTVAAVELLNQGRVWVDTTLEVNQRLVLASASATLLLQQELELPEAE